MTCHQKLALRPDVMDKGARGRGEQRGGVDVRAAGYCGSCMHFRLRVGLHNVFP